MSAKTAGPYQAHITSPSDLETSYHAYRAGFVSLALERNRRATPFVDEARKLKAAASAASHPADLLKIAEIRGALLTASGLSDKALSHIEESDRNAAIEGLIGKFLEPAGENFVEELVYRFLLTRGDALGGSMRNVGGALAQSKFSRSIISYLNIAGITYWWRDKSKNNWVIGESPAEDAGIEIGVSGLAWKNKAGSRTLIYNLTVPAVKNNIDVCLFSLDQSTFASKQQTVISEPKFYLALGEIKGGIDPAGADEHWKTARTALDRIHVGFKEHPVPTFFIGAAIEKKMATEIWHLLLEGTITNAANLTNEEQLSSITKWLCEL